MFDILELPFLQTALLAGTCLAVVAAAMGYFLILRGLTFAGHALPNIGFAGAAGAVLLGLNPLVGLFVFTMAAGVSIAMLGKEAHKRDITIGIIMTFALGLGMLFLALYSGYAERVYSILFGTILGISQQDVLVTAVAGALTLAVLLAIWRPLLFSSLDPQVAQARGVPVRLLAIVFLVLVAISVSIAIQVIGVLLVFVLLVGPAATAVRLTQRPPWAVMIAMLLGVLYTWLGIVLAALSGTWPVSFLIATISFLVYLPVRLLSPRWMQRADKRRQESRAEALFPLMTKEVAVVPSSTVSSFSWAAPDTSQQFATPGIDDAGAVSDAWREYNV
ncbi:MAG: metal ABC transporter permease [Ktedonobacteraceae bacterium]|nr:metal ABC transporter permease [Ktedonobacteraceae bacterium]